MPFAISYFNSLYINLSVVFIYKCVCATSVPVRVKVKRNYPCKSVESVGKLVKKLDLILQDSSSFAIPCSDEYDEIQYATARVYNV